MPNEVPSGQTTHTLEEIDAGVSEVENTKGNAASLTAAITEIADTEAAAAAATAAAAAVETAISALDVSSKGGSGKYISAIEEADGKINATPTNLASSVTSSGNTAVSGAAVYAAISDKITATQAVSTVYGLGTNIAVGDDLNSDTYKVVGSYYTSTTERCAGAIHRPDFADANKKVFRLDVKTMNSASRYIQEMTTFMATATGAEPQGYVERFIRAYTSGGWGAWYQMNTTAVNTYAPASLNSINPAQLQVTPPDGDDERGDMYA